MARACPVHDAMTPETPRTWARDSRTLYSDPASESWLARHGSPSRRPGSPCVAVTESRSAQG